MAQRDETASGNDPRSFILSSVSLGLIWGWTYLFSINIAGISGATQNWSSLLALTWKVVTALSLAACLLRKKRGAPAASVEKIMAVVSGALGVSCTLLLVLCSAFWELAPFLQITSIVLFGACYGLYLLSWIRSAAAIAQRYSFVLFNIGLSCVIAGLTYLLAQNMHGRITTIVLCILPSLAWFMLMRFPFPPQHQDLDAVPLPALMPPKRVLLAVAFISLSLGISCQVAASGPLPGAWVNGSILAGMLLCAVTAERKFPERLNMYFFALVIFTGGCLAFILPFASRYTATTIIRVASFITMSNALAISAYYFAQQERTYGILGFVSYVLPLAGGEGLWIIWKDDVIYLLIFASFFLALAICVFLYKRDASQPLSDLPSKLNSASDTQAAERRVAQLRDQYNLSARETEILLPLSKGYSLKTIAQSQGVSINTIKSQVRSVYSKLNIHAKEDLIELFDAMD